MGASRSRGSGSLPRSSVPSLGLPLPGRRLSGSSPKPEATRRDGRHESWPSALCLEAPQQDGQDSLSLSLNSQADPHPAALRSGGSCTLSPCRPGVPAWPSAPASPWARGERWVRAHGAAGTAASGAKDGLAIDVLVSVSGSLSLSLLASTNSPHSTCLTPSHPWAPPRSHLLLAALPDYSLPPLGSVLPGPPQVSVNTRVPSSVEAPNCGLPSASGAGGRSFWSLELLHTSSGPAWGTEGSGRGLGTWGWGAQEA